MKKQPVTTLRQVLNFLDDDSFSAVQEYLKDKELSQGETLFEVGDLGEELFFLVEGQLAVKKNTGFEDKMQVVALLSSGACVGECAVVGGRDRTTTVIATEKCKLISLNKYDYEKLRETHSKVALDMVERLLKVSSLRLHECTGRLAHIL